MTAAHLIQELCFETDFASEETAFEAQERLMRFAQGRAQQVISEVFDELIDPDTILRLERLEVDVGTVTAPDFEERFAERLREALRAALSERQNLAPEIFGMESSREAGDSMGTYTRLALSHGVGRPARSTADLESFVGLTASAGPCTEPESLIGLTKSAAPCAGPESLVSPAKSPSQCAELKSPVSRRNAAQLRAHEELESFASRPLSVALPKWTGSHAGLDSSVALRHSVSSPDALTTATRAELEWLLHFIEQGFLPWHAPTHIGRDVEALAARVLQRTGPELARALRTIPFPQWRPIFRRLVAQFPAPWLAELGQEIERARREASATGAGKLANTRRAAMNGLRDSVPERLTDTAELAPVAEELVSDTAGFAFGAEEPVTDAVELAPGAEKPVRDAAGFASGAEELATDAADLVSGAEGLVSDAAARITDAAKLVTGAGELATDAEARTHARRTRIEALLTETLESGTARVASTPVPAGTWREILRDDADWLKATLLRLGYAMRVRRRLAAVLPEEILTGVLGLWLRPAQVDLVLATIGAPTKPFSPETQSTVVRAGTISTRRLLAALTYILAEGGASGFSELNYRRSLTSQAAHDSRESQQLQGVAAKLAPASRVSADCDTEPTTLGGSIGADAPSELDVASAADAVSAVWAASAPTPASAPVVVPVTVIDGTPANVSSTDPLRPSYDGAYFQPNRKSVEVPALGPGKQAVSEIPAVSHTALPDQLPEALDGPHEAPPRSRARTYIEAILCEPPESDFPPITSAAATADTWRRVLRDDPRWLKETLLRLGRGIRARRRLTTVLPREVVGDVLTLWLSPGQVEAAWATHNVDTASLTGEMDNTDAPREALSPAWLLTTLTYILVDGGASQFNESAFRASLANQTARGRDDAVYSDGTYANPTFGPPSNTSDPDTGGAARPRTCTTAQSATDLTASTMPDCATGATDSANETTCSEIHPPEPPVPTAPPFHDNSQPMDGAATRRDTIASPGVSAPANTVAAKSRAMPANVAHPTVPAPVPADLTAAPANLTSSISITQALPGLTSAPAAAFTETPANLTPAPTSLTPVPAAFAQALTDRPAVLTRHPNPTAGAILPGATLAASGALLAPPEIDLLRHLRGAPTPNLPSDALRRTLRALLEQRSAAGRGELHSALEYPGAGRRLAGLLAGDDLADLLQWLRPTEGAMVLAIAARVIGSTLDAVQQTRPRQDAARGPLSVASGLTDRRNNTHNDRDTPTDTDAVARTVNELLLIDLFEEGRTLEPVSFAQRLTAALGDTLAPRAKPAPLTGSGTENPMGATNPEATTNVAGTTNVGGTTKPEETTNSGGITKSGGITNTKRTTNLAHPHPTHLRRTSARQNTNSPRVQSASAAEDAALTQRIYIGNAGVVIVGPYLPRLFSILQLTDKDSFTSLSSAHRAVHLIQYIVTGATSTPEPVLVLNKILCGLPITAPIPLDIDLRAREQAAIEDMLAAIIAHWKAIGRTSVAGLRESFLQRDGRLSATEDTWQLRVESKCFDMLLDRLPWAYTMLKYPWMKRVLHVDWR